MEDKGVEEMSGWVGWEAVERERREMMAVGGRMEFLFFKTLLSRLPVRLPSSVL